MDENDRQTPEEVAAQMSGAIAVAFEWFEAAATGYWDRLWSLSDPEFKLVRAQAWLWANRDAGDLPALSLDEQAELMVSRSHPLWGEFAAMESGGYSRALSGFDLDQIAAATRPRPVAVDYELVLLAPGVSEIELIEEARMIASFAMLMHVVEGSWLVANTGTDERLVPGWPPRFPGAPEML